MDTIAHGLTGALVGYCGFRQQGGRTVLWEMSGRRNLRLLWLASAAGIASHLLLDWITSYGTMLWWPVSDARLALSLVFIVEPYV